MKEIRFKFLEMRDEDAERDIYKGKQLGLLILVGADLITQIEKSWKFYERLEKMPSGKEKIRKLKTRIRE